MAKRTKLFNFGISIAVSLAVVFIIVIFASKLYPQVPLYLFLWSRYSPEKTPFAYVVPNETLVVPLINDERSDYSEISLGSMRVQLPVNEDITIKRPREEVVIVSGSEKTIVSLMMMYDYDPSNDILAGLSDADKNLYKSIYGCNVFDSFYEYQRAAMITTPASLSLSSQPEDIIRATVFLLLKGALMHPQTHGAYWIELGDVPGFQAGLPGKGDEPVRLFLYPPDGKEYQLFLSVKTQQEILDFLGSVSFEPGIINKSIANKCCETEPA